jgi:hypothetical protein
MKSTLVIVTEKNLLCWSPAEPHKALKMLGYGAPTDIFSMMDRTYATLA